MSRTRDENEPLTEEIAEYNAFNPDLAVDEKVKTYSCCTNVTQPTGSSTSGTKNTLDMPITVYPAYFFHFLFLLRSRPVPCIPGYIPPLRPL